MEKIKILFERWWMILVLLVCLPIFYNNAVVNEQDVDYANNGFFTFWLAGHMNWTGQHPYLHADWLAGHETHNSIFMTDEIFSYPLPLALILAPLGIFPMDQAYIIWGVVAQMIIAVGILSLTTFWEGLNRRLFAVLIVVAFLLNSNIKLLLQSGTIGALFLLFLLLALYCKQKNWDFVAGLVLALMALKPPFLTIVALIGLWLLFRRNWKMIGGLITGGLVLLCVGLLQDIDWVNKFRGVSSNLFNIRLGNQPTIISYTRLACGGEMTCAFGVYALIVLLLIGLYAWLVWKKRDTITPLTVFSAASALGVLLPPYLWSYDYVLLVIPLCYICMDSIRRTSSYIFATLFLIVLDGLSFGMAYMFWLNPASSALTIQRDMWSIWVGILILVTAWWMIFAEKPQPTTIVSESAQG